MAVTYSETIPMGTLAPSFSLPGTDGNTYALESFDAPVLVIVFMCVHCPFVIPIEDKLISLQLKYGDKVQFGAICSNDAETYPGDSFENMTARAEEKEYPFPYLQDESQEVAKAYQAKCTPDIYVYDQDRKLVYHGRIDDSARGALAPTTNDLEEALEAIVEGKKLDREQVPSHGCNVKWG